MSMQRTVSVDTRFTARPAGVAWMPWAEPGISSEGHGSAVLCGPVLSFAADSEIYGEGNEAKSFYKVMSGVVRTCKFLSDGRRQITAFYHAGEVFGVESGARHGYSAEAVNDCTVVAYRRGGLEALAATDEVLVRQLFRYAIQCAERAQKHALVLGRRGAAEKLAAFLLEMAEPRPTGEPIDLAMTRQDIADYLGLTIETVSRTMSQFERDGVIALASTRRVRLQDRAALQDLNA
jgi:CRP/FNR family nitrogen fixation transcriptional regulator